MITADVFTETEGSVGRGDVIHLLTYYAVLEPEHNAKALASRGVMELRGREGKRGVYIKDRGERGRRVREWRESSSSVNKRHCHGWVS